MVKKLLQLPKLFLLVFLVMTLLFLLQSIVDSPVWNVLELLLIPLALALGIWWLNKKEKENEREIVESREKIEREIARTKQQEVILEAYFDRMTHLLLDQDLRNSDYEDEVRGIAQARTITTLARLDNENKSKVIVFLCVSGLLKSPPIVSLKKANLRKIDLSGENLHGSQLIECDFSEAIFENTTLSSANLSGSNFKNARMKGAYLKDTNLTNCNFTNTDLERATFCENKAELRKYSSSPSIGFIQEEGANLSSANLTNANLTNAFLKKAQFIEANLTKANLENANLSEALLNRTIMTDANINGVNFRDALFYSIDLRNLNLDNSQLSQIASFSGCILPNGQRIKGTTYKELKKELSDIA